MPDFTVRYADFKGGHYGLRDPAKADADTFHGSNVHMYDSGLLGVRAGVKQLPVTGLPVHPTVPGPLGFFASGSTLILMLAKPYSFGFSGGAATAWAAMPVTPTGPVRFIVGNGIIYVLSSGVLYKYSSPSSVAPITTPAPLSYIVRWGYYFIGIDANRPWRLWYSDVSAAGANFDSWPANNYIDIGNTEAITGLWPIYNTLYVGKRDGWWAVSGVLATPSVTGLASVREVAIGLGTVDPRLATVTTDNRIVYWPIASAPAFFNGERVDVHEAQEIDPRDTSFPCDTVIVTPTSRRIVMCSKIAGGGTYALTYADRAWTHHRFPSLIAGLVPSEVRDGDMLPEDVLYAVLAPTTIGDPVLVGSWHHQLNRPAHLSDTYANPIDYAGVDLVAGTASFPTYWEPIGRQVQVRGIVVQFRKWPSGVSESFNEIHVRLDAHGRYSGGRNQGETHRWVEPCERSMIDGTDDSWRINVGDQGFGNGFQVVFPKLVGVALREVIVLCTVRTERM